MAVTEREQREIEAANGSDRRPVVFVHGLWLLAGSWWRWRELFAAAGFSTVAPGWPDDPETVEEALAKPDALAKKTVKQVTDHHAEVIDRLKQRPAVVGHSFGGLIAQQLAGSGLAAVSVAIDPAPFRGVLPLPFSALRAAWPVLRNPGNRGRAVALTFEQFRYAFANAVSEAEARELYDTYAVPAPGAPLFQAAFANLNPSTEVAVNTRNPKRGPLLVLSGEKDNTVPWAIAHASFKRQRRNAAPTRIQEVVNRGHSLTIDSGWRDVAEVALAFVKEQLLGEARANAAVPTLQPEATRGVQPRSSS